MNINANLSALKLLQQNMNGLGSVGSPLDALLGGGDKGGSDGGPLSLLSKLGQDSPIAKLLQGGASQCGGQDAQQAMSVLQEVQGQEDDGDDADLG